MSNVGPTMMKGRPGQGKAPRQVVGFGSLLGAPSILNEFSGGSTFTSSGNATNPGPWGSDGRNVQGVNAAGGLVVVKFSGTTGRMNMHAGDSVEALAFVLVNALAAGSVDFGFRGYQDTTNVQVEEVRSIVGIDARPGEILQCAWTPTVASITKVAPCFFFNGTGAGAFNVDIEFQLSAVTVG